MLWFSSYVIVFEIFWKGKEKTNRRHYLLTDPRTIVLEQSSRLVSILLWHARFYIIFWFLTLNLQNSIPVVDLSKFARWISLVRFPDKYWLLIRYLHDCFSSEEEPVIFFFPFPLKFYTYTSRHPLASLGLIYN